MTEDRRIRRSPIAAKHCNLARSFELIGDRWTLLILRSALYGVRRFDDFQTDLDIPRSVLSSRLAGLVEVGIMERRDYREDGQRPRVEYPLTEMGRSLAIPFLAMTQWGDRWVGNGRTPLTLHSKASGRKLSIGLVDDSGHTAALPDLEIRLDRKLRRSTD